MLCTLRLLFAFCQCIIHLTAQPTKKNLDILDEETNLCTVQERASAQTKVCQFPFNYKNKTYYGVKILFAWLDNGQLHSTL